MLPVQLNQSLALARRLLLKICGGQQMSAIDVPPDGTFTQLERVLRRQRRLAMWNVAATSMFAGGLILTVVSMLS
jgi:hypothetical protein